MNSNVKSENNDCQILYIGNSHETYRGVNNALGSLGLNVMWVQDLDSAEMLAKTSNTAVMLCDRAVEGAKRQLFKANTIQSGASCVEMRLPEPDPSGGLLERNINRTAQLLKVMRNLNVAGDLQAAG
jgi:hypothetical protein